MSPYIVTTKRPAVHPSLLCPPPEDTVHMWDERMPARFWAKVVPGVNGCWFWTGSLTGKGYASFHDSDGQINRRAHRVAYERLIGPIADGLELDHLCRVRHCVNPSHLEPVTAEENRARGERGSTTATSCHRGHAFTPENTGYDRGSRVCLACSRMRNANRTLRRREQRKAQREVAS